MRRNLPSSLLALLLILILQPSCNVDTVDSLHENTNIRKGARIASCGGTFDGSYPAGNGFHIYPSIALDFTGACNGGKVSVSFSAEDVPNRFTIRDQTGNVVVQSGQQPSTSGHNGFIGTTSDTGPWGDPFSTGGSSETLIFTYDSSKSYTLNVETSTSGVSDHWSSSIGCTTNCPVGPLPPVTCKPDTSCTQYFDGNYASGGGFHIYQAIPLNFTSICPNRPVSITVYASGVPNRFTVRDQSGTVIAQSGSGQGHNGFIGTTSDYGPWGNPFSGSTNQESLTFYYNNSKTYTLWVETSTTGENDYWSASKSCN